MPDYPINDGDRTVIFLSSDEEEEACSITSRLDVCSSGGFIDNEEWKQGLIYQGCIQKSSPALSVQSACDATSSKNQTTDVYSFISACPSTDNRAPPMTMIQSVRKTSEDSPLVSRDTPHSASTGLRSCNSLVMDRSVIYPALLSYSPSYSSLHNNRNNKWTSSYNSRLAQFRQRFRNTPVDTNRLLVAYSCALSKNSLLHQGRMYVTEKWICFYSKILYEQKIYLSVKEIVSITKRKTAHVIPNAIQIIYSKSREPRERFFFTSFATRDRTFAILHKVWENCRKYETMSIEEIMQQLREIYGEDSVTILDGDEDPEDLEAVQHSSISHADGSLSECSDPVLSPSVNTGHTDKELGTWSSTEDEHARDVDGDEEGELETGDPMHAEIMGEYPGSTASKSRWHVTPTSTHSLQSYPCSVGRKSTEPAAGTDSATTENEGELRHFQSTSQLSLGSERKQRIRRKSKPSKTTAESQNVNSRKSPSVHRFSSAELDSEADSDVPITCSSGHNHPGVLYLDTEVSLSIDALFNCLFTNSNFFHNLCLSRGTYDVEQATWPKVNWPSQPARNRDGDASKMGNDQDNGNTIERTISYTLVVKNALLTKPHVAVEKQTLLLNESRPGRCYVLTAKVTNVAIPFCTCFHVVSYYCLVRTSRFSSQLRVSSQIVFQKFPFIPTSIIERSCHSGLRDFFDALKGKLAEYTADLTDDERLTGGWLSAPHSDDVSAYRAAGRGARHRETMSAATLPKTYSDKNFKLAERKTAQRTGLAPKLSQAATMNSNKANTGSKTAAASQMDRSSTMTLPTSTRQYPVDNGYANCDKPRLYMLSELLVSPYKSISYFFLRPDRAWMLLVLIGLLLCLFLSMVYNRLVSLEKLADHLSTSMPYVDNHASRLPATAFLKDQIRVPAGSYDDAAQARVKTMSHLVNSMTKAVEQIQKTLRDIQELMSLLDISSGKPPSAPVEPLPQPLLPPTPGK